MKDEQFQHPNLLTSKPGLPAGSEELVQTIIVKGHKEGMAHFGDLGLDIKTYADRIQSITQKNLGSSAPEREVLAFAARLHLCDLYLATSCAQKDLGEHSDTNIGHEDCSLAWKTMGKVYGGFINDLARFLSRENLMAHDVADDIVADLFMPDRSGVSRILSYDGRSSLSTWLRVILANRITNARRSKSYSHTDPIESNVPDKAVVVSIDKIIRAKRYGWRVVDSIKIAFGHLKPIERSLLLWRHEEGLQLNQIAGLLDIHQSNITRRLERIYHKLRNLIFAHLSDKHGLARSMVEECIQDLLDPQGTMSTFCCIERSTNGGGSEMKHISEIIRELLREDAYIREHESKILKYYTNRASVAPEKKRPASVSMPNLRDSDAGRDLPK